MTLDDILDQINKADKIVILTHENPDGDAMGSSLAMYHALKAYGKNPDIITPEHSKVFNCLPGIEQIKTKSDVEHYDLAISLDCAAIKMLNGFSNYFENAKVKVSIDHHGTNTMFGDYNYVNPDSPACSQILLVILEYFGIEITKDIGTCILAGIITDTGGFKYQGVTAETFEFVAWLLNKGVNVSKVYRQVLETKTKANFELHRIANNRVEFLEDGKVAYTYITKEDEESVHAENGDYEGIVENARDVENVEVSIFIRQTEKGCKVSLRSNEYVNVADACIAFGGGGHPKAAGCTIPGTIEQAKEMILKEIVRLL